MKRGRHILALALALIWLAACGANSAEMSPTHTEEDLTILATVEPQDKALLDAMELARRRAIQLVTMLAEQGDPDRFLGNQAFADDSAFLKGKLDAFSDTEARRFLNETFLNPEGYAKELRALREAKFAVTSLPANVMVNGQVKHARANPKNKEIRFYQPWVDALTPEERMALLLHEIWHHLGLPDEDTFGPFAKTQIGIDMASAAQVAFWIGRTQRPMPADNVPNQWPTRFSKYFSAPTTQPVRSELDNQRLANFHLRTYLRRPEYRDAMPSEAKLYFRIDAQGRYFAWELSRAAGNSSPGTTKLIYFDGTKRTVLYESEAWTAIVWITAWNQIIEVNGVRYHDPRNTAGGFAIELSNAETYDPILIKSPY